MKFEKRSMGATVDVSSGNQGSWSLVKTIAKYLVVFVALFIALTLIADHAVSMMPDSWERRLASSLSPPAPRPPQTEEPSPFSFLRKTVTSEDLERVKKIKTKLMEGRRWRELDYEVDIAEWGMGPNAFATLGGRVTVTPELLDVLKTEEGLAFIIAHELAHHEHRHVLKTNTKNLAVGLVFLTIGATAGEGLISSSTTLPLLASNRSMEEEADAFAANLICEKYGSVQNIDEFFVWVQENDPHSKWLTWTSTHPHPESRLDMVRKFASKCTRGKPAGLTSP